MPDTVTMRISSGEWMPSFFGQMRLDPDGGDFSRVGLGVMAFLADHRAERPIGRVTRMYTSQGEVLATSTLTTAPNAQGVLAELHDGIRSGVSPGFLIKRTRVLEPDDPEYNARFLIQEVVTEWEAFEASSTTTPRDKRAMVLSGLRPNGAASLAPTGRKAALGPATGPVTPETRRRIAAAIDAAVAPIRETLAEMEGEADMERQRAREFTGAPAVHTAKNGPEGPRETQLSRVIRGFLNGAPVREEKGVKIETSGYRSGTAQVPTLECAAVITTSAPGTVGVNVAPAIAAQTPGLGSVERIFQLPRLIFDVPNGAPVSYGVETTAPTAHLVGEGSTAAEGNPVYDTTGSGVLKPIEVQTKAEISLQLAIQGGAQFETELERSIRRVTREKIISEFLTGDGVAPRPTGLVNTTGLQVATYAALAKGSPTSIRATESLVLDSDVDPQRPTWLLSKDMWTTARDTIREPGNGTYVLERGFLLADTRAIRSGLLAVGTGVFGAWEDSTLVLYSDSLLVVNGISKPGTLILTLISYFQFRFDRVGSFGLLRAA